MTPGGYEFSGRTAASAEDSQLTEIVKTHRTALLAYAVRLTGGDRARAEDVVQETFVRAWKHLDRLTPGQGSVRGWLLRVAHNLVVDGYRAVQARPTEVEIEQAETAPAADTSDHVLTSVMVERALAALAPEHRAAVVECYLRDRTAAEAAIVLGVPVGTVKSRVFYALRRLRSTVDQAQAA
jgi:RNA polymerase sigma-70 factor, ECF subfamily